MKPLTLAVLLILFPALVSAQQLDTFANGEVADANAVNANFKNIDDRLKAIEDGETNEPGYLEQQVLPNGDVFTKLYLYETASFSGFSIDRQPDGGAFEDWGQEQSTNALGSFHGAYFYKYPPADAIASPTGDTPTGAVCPGGEAPEFWYQAEYEYSIRQASGALQFSTTSGDISGIYQCLSFDCGADCPNNFNEYYILQGQDVGDYSCVKSAVMYGLSGAANARGISKIRGENLITGVFDPDSNGPFGTYYLEITAPSGCLPGI